MNEQDFETFCDFVRKLLSTVNHTLEIQPGRKYIRLFMIRSGSSGSSAWAFVDKQTGEIFKPATYRAPAKHARGNVAQPLTYSDYKWTGPHYMRG